MIENREESLTDSASSKKVLKNKKGRKITSSKRDVDFISQVLDETVSEDIHLKGIFDPK